LRQEKPQKKVDGRKIFEVTSRFRASRMNDIPAMQQNILMVQQKIQAEAACPPERQTEPT